MINSLKVDEIAAGPSDEKKSANNSLKVDDLLDDSAVLDTTCEGPADGGRDVQTTEEKSASLNGDVEDNLKGAKEEVCNFREKQSNMWRIFKKKN